jgi:ketosteroid isomerase-like protein
LFFLNGGFLSILGSVKIPEAGHMNNQVVLQFIEAINGHDVDKICSLMTDGHKFIDCQGNEIIGRDNMRKGWTAYFQWFPDYKIEVTDTFVRDDTVVAFGFASGTFHGLKERKEMHWHLPASWKVKVLKGRISVWQVYADSKIPYDIINKSK